MSQETRVSNPDDLESIVRENWRKKNRLVHHLAARMGVAHEAEDLAQNAWARAVKKRDAVENARNVSALLNTIASREVINFASHDKLRVHISFEEGTDGLMILGNLGLEGDFTDLKTRRDPSGLPLYSGKIWPSRLEDLWNHPNRVYLNVVGLRGFVLVDPHVLANSAQMIEDLEVSDSIQVEPYFSDGFSDFWTAINAELRGAYGIHTLILISREVLEMEWADIAELVGFGIKTCQKYNKIIKIRIRECYPHFRDLLGEV